MKFLWPIHLLGSLAILVMFPTAIAAWYSNCFKIPLSYGFGIFFSSIIVNLMVVGLMKEVPSGNTNNGAYSNEKKDYIHTTASSFLEGAWSIGMAILIIYGVHLQLKGKCNLPKMRR